LTIDGGIHRMVPGNCGLLHRDRFGRIVRFVDVRAFEDGGVMVPKGWYRSLGLVTDLVARQGTSRHRN